MIDRVTLAIFQVFVPFVDELAKPPQWLRVRGAVRGNDLFESLQLDLNVILRE